MNMLIAVAVITIAVLMFVAFSYYSHAASKQGVIKDELRRIKQKMTEAEEKMKSIKNEIRTAVKEKK